MNKIFSLTATVLVALVILLAGCTGPMTPGAYDVTTIDSIGSLVQNMPELRANLPASLSTDTGTNDSTRSISRAMGDVVTVEASNLESVRSSGWAELQRQTGVEPNTKAVLEVVKLTIPNDVQDGDIVTAGLIDLADVIPGAQSKIVDFGKYRVTGSSTSASLEWFFTMDQGYSEPLLVDYYLVLVVSYDGSDYRVELTGNMATEEWGTSAIYASFDSGSSESVLAQSVGGYSGVTHAAPNSDGSFSVLMKSDTGSSVAWGNDTMGGILSKYAYETSVYAYGEFYGADGALISRSWGDNDLSRIWFPPEEERFNLQTLEATAPSEFWIKDTSGDGAWDSYSTDGTTWPTLTGYDPNSHWSIVWVESDGVLTEGDTEYYWTDWDNAKSATRMTAGYQVPAAETFLGEPLFMSYMYPLKRLLPLADTHADYNVAREEGETQTGSWTDWEGETHEESWTSYQYFLDHQSAGTQGDLDENDLHLPEVNFEEMYYYDADSGRYAMVEAPMVRVDGELPAYYTFSDQSIVDSVTAEIMSIYDNELADMSLADYEAFLVDLSGDPRFDELK